MNEITRIHLARTAYDIELSAKKKLDNYVDDIEHTLHDDKDMMYEIELRIVEILKENGISPGGVITISDVEIVQKTLGSAADFSDEDSDKISKSDLDDGERKLFRDESTGIIGGVCSGLATYFKVDAWIVRLVFLVLAAITSGGFVIVYIILMIFVPPARSAGDRLQMSGRSATLQSLRGMSDLPYARSRAITIGRTLVRVIGVAAMIGMVILILTGMAVVLGAVFSFVNISTVPWLAWGISMGSIGLLGLVIALSALAIMIWRSSTPRRTVIAFWSGAGIAAVLGIAGILLTGFQFTFNKPYAQLQDNTVSTSEPLDLQDVSTLGVNSSTPTSITYIVSSDKPTLQISSPKQLKQTISHELTSTGKTSKRLDFYSVEDFGCKIIHACATSLAVTIYGPELKQIDLMTDGQFEYQNSNQDSLDVKSFSPSPTSTAKINVQNINELSLQSYGASIDLPHGTQFVVTNQHTNILNIRRDGPIENTITISGDVALAKLYQPKSCSGQKSNIMFKSIESALINGEPVDLPSTDAQKIGYECFDFEKINISPNAL